MEERVPAADVHAAGYFGRGFDPREIVNPDAERLPAPAYVVRNVVNADQRRGGLRGGNKRSYAVYSLEDAARGQLSQRAVHRQSRRTKGGNQFVLAGYLLSRPIRSVRDARHHVLLDLFVER